MAPNVTHSKAKFDRIFGTTYHFVILVDVPKAKFDIIFGTTYHFVILIDVPNLGARSLIHQPTELYMYLCKLL